MPCLLLQLTRPEMANSNGQREEGESRADDQLLQEAKMLHSQSKGELEETKTSTLRLQEG